MRKKNTGLTKRDLDTLRCIKNYMLKNGVTPTIRQICEELNVHSPSAVHIHFKRLVELGYIIPRGETRYTVRGIKYVETEE